MVFHCDLVSNPKLFQCIAYGMLAHVHLIYIYIYIHICIYIYIYIYLYVCQYRHTPDMGFVVLYLKERGSCKEGSMYIYIYIYIYYRGLIASAPKMTPHLYTHQYGAGMLVDA